MLLEQLVDQLDDSAAVLVAKTPYRILWLESRRGDAGYIGFSRSQITIAQ